MKTRILPGLGAPHIALLVLTLVSTLSLSGPNASAQTTPSPPELMTYQGFLADANGAPLGASTPKNYDVVFRIFDAATGGNVLWGEQQTVVVDKGNFSVLLGEGSGVGAHPALSTLFANNTASDRWIGITVKGIGSGGGDADILPRLRLMSSPYSFLAQKAISANTALTAQNAITAQTAATVTSVDGSAVTSGYIADERLSPNVALKNGNNVFGGGQYINGLLEVGNEFGNISLNAYPPGTDSVLLGILSGNLHGPQLRFTGAAGGGFVDIGQNDSGNFVIEHRDSAKLIVSPNGNVLVPNGNVGIGTTSPSPLNKLQINDYPDSRAVANGYGLAVNNSIYGANIQIARNYGESGLGLVVDNAGYGSTSTSLLLVRNNITRLNGGGGFLCTPLDVRADANTGLSFVSIGFNTPPLNFALTVNGAIGGLGPYYDFSDARLKKNVQTLPNALSTVMRLRGVNFEWRQSEFPDLRFAPGNQLGFIAQEVQKVLPELVTQDGKGFMTVAYSHLIPVLTEAIKQQQTEIESKAAQIESLESRLASLEAKDKERSDKVAALELLVREKLGTAQQAKVGTPAR